MTAPDDSERFWEIAAGYLERPGVTRATMMGFPCLRLNGDFLASWDPTGRALVAKLDAATVSAMISDGSGEAFAPNGRRFREWISVPPTGSATWAAVIDHAFDLSVERQRRHRGP